MAINDIARIVGACIPPAVHPLTSARLTVNLGCRCMLSAALVTLHTR